VLVLNDRLRCRPAGSREIRDLIQDLFFLVGDGGHHCALSSHLTRTQAQRPEPRKLDSSGILDDGVLVREGVCSELIAIEKYKRELSSR